jgi:hypothetical protein
VKKVFEALVDIARKELKKSPAPLFFTASRSLPSTRSLPDPLAKASTRSRSRSRCSPRSPQAKPCGRDR